MVKEMVGHALEKTKKEQGTLCMHSKFLRENLSNSTSLVMEFNLGLLQEVNNLNNKRREKELWACQVHKIPN